MCKVIVGILASEGYDQFKEIWVKNIKYIKSTSNTFDFYFIYGGCCNKIVKNDFYTDFYNDSVESIKNMTIKTLKFYKYIIENIKFDFVLRTNLSTLFDFVKMNEWFSNIQEKNFFSGSIISNFSYEYTLISGVNTVFSCDIVNFLNDNFYKFSYDENEDVETSKMVFNNVKNINFKSIIRIDFLSENTMLYHKCSEIDNDDIFCFRFKSNNRDNDVKNMNYILNKIILKKLDYKKNIKFIKCENPEMNIYSKSIYIINKN